MFWLLLAIVGIVLLWWHRTRQARATWLRSLDLVGKWELQTGESTADAQPQRSLTLSGTLAGGSYAARDGDIVQRGDWRLNGNTLTLAPTEGDSESSLLQRYELRLFGNGKIGIDGPGRQREIYVKREGNVIPLARQPKRRG